MSPNWSPGDALARAERRRSPWRIVAIPLGFACAIGVFLLASNIALRAQVFWAPDDVFFCTPTHPSAIVLFLALAVLSIPIGFMIANLLLWIVPPIRAALARAEASAGGSFATANLGLIKFAAVSALVLLPVCVAAAGSRVCLSDSKIYHQSSVLSSLQSSDMSQVAELRPRCEKGGRGGWDFGLEIVLTDGASFGLAVVGPWFSASSQRILNALQSVRSNNAGIDPDCPAGLRILITR